MDTTRTVVVSVPSDENMETVGAPRPLPATGDLLIASVRPGFVLLLVTPTVPPGTPAPDQFPIESVCDAMTDMLSVLTAVLIGGHTDA